MKRQQWIGLLVAVATFVCGSAFADETVSIGGSNAVLIRPKAPRASVILMPGGSGAIAAGDHGDIHGLQGNQLVRTRQAYAARGLAVRRRCSSRTVRSQASSWASISERATKSR